MGSVGKQVPVEAVDGGNSTGQTKSSSTVPILSEVTVYVKAGVDNERMGACPFCHRVFMVLLMKAHHGLLKIKVLTTNLAKPPAEFKIMGLNHVPAIIHGEDGYDVLDDIIQYLDDRFPGGGLDYSNQEADLVTRNFFSRFCYYIKAVNQDPTKLDVELQRLNAFMERLPPATEHVPPALQNGKSHNGHQNNSQEGKSQNGCTHSEDEKEKLDVITPGQFLCGSTLTHLDCEVLPKLQHLRVAAKTLKNYDIPTNLRGFWRYMHTAYTHPVFARTCPSDQEIALHWHDRPETPNLSRKEHSAIAKQQSKYSFDVPVYAACVTLVDD